MQTIKLVLFIQIFLLFVACSNTNQTSGLKNISGRPGEVVVVMSDEVWEGTVDSVFMKVLTQPQLGLPQAEPIFNLYQVPIEAFTDIFKTSRNLLLVYVGGDVDSTSIFFGNDKYAYPQAFISINAKNKEELLQIFNSSSDKIIGFLLKAERERLMLNYSKLNEKIVSDKARELFAVTLNVAPGFKVASATNNFMWARYETPETSQGIFIYSIPYESDSTFTVNYLTVQRNLFMKNNVPGPIEGSFMATETELPLLFNTFKKDGNYTAEIRGLWKIENDFMGGPFISHSVLDLLNKRVVTVEGYVYAPGKDKRNLLRQVEAMVYTLKFDDQKDMDKLNKQFE